MGKAYGRGRDAFALGLVLAGVLLVCCPCARALNPSLDINQYAHTSWKTREGFSKGRITSIAQTPDGYLWLGTQFGLLRFDGVRPEPWQPPAGQHLPSSIVAGMHAARDGTLWIGTFEGLASWKDGRLTQYPEVAGNSIFALFEDREGTVWVGGATPSLPLSASGRLCEIRGRRVQCYGEDGKFGDGVDSVYEDSKGSLWVGSDNGLWRWKPGSPQHYAFPGQLPGITALTEVDNGTLLMANREGIRQLVGGKAVAYALPGIARPVRPRTLFRSGDGSLWIGTVDRGLVHVHQGRTDWFTQADGLSGDYVASLFEDREGDIWVATNGGLDRFRDVAIPTISSKQGLPDAVTWSVLAARDGSVWFGSTAGVSRWKDGHLTIYRMRRSQSPASAPPKSQLTPAAVREIADSGLPDAVQSIFQDDQGRIWVTTARGIACFDGSQFSPVNGVPGEEVCSIAVDHQGNLWMSSAPHGLFHLLDGNRLEQFPWSRLARGDYALALPADPLQGALWLGFYQGGVAYFRDGQIRASYSAADGLGEGPVAGLQLDPDGTLWAATQGGLSRLKNGHVATLTSKNGLPCDTVLWAERDDDHSFWLYMDCGLVRIAASELDAWVADPKRQIHVTVFDSFDGVSLKSRTGGFGPRVTKSADGRLWFTVSDGVSVLDPRHLPFNKLPPPVQIEQITAPTATFIGETHRAMRLRTCACPRGYAIWRSITPR